MMERKEKAVKRAGALIVCLVLLTNACTIYRIEKIPGNAVGREPESRLRIVKVLKDSGEVVEYPKNSPAVIREGAVVHPNSPPIPVSSVLMLWARALDSARSTAASFSFMAWTLFAVTMGLIII